MGATAVGAAGTMVAMAPAAGALDGDNVVVGQTVATSADSAASTAIDYATAAARSTDGNANAIFAVTESGATELITTAIAGVAGGKVLDAVGGATSSPDGTGVIGLAIDGVGVAGLSNTGIGEVGASIGSADLVAPAGRAYANTASINWFGPNQNIATTVISALGGDRQIVVHALNRTHFIVDVTGYFS